LNKTSKKKNQTCRSTFILKGRDPSTMGYFDNLDNGFLNKYQKDLKNRKKFIDMLFYL
jgi:hypothetical protein